MRWLLPLLLSLLGGCAESCAERRMAPEPTASAPAPAPSEASPIHPPPVPVPQRLKEADRLLPDAPARPLAERCDDGSPRACWLLAGAYERGEQGLSVERASARRLYRRACREGALGCVAAARLHPDQAAAYLERGCQAGDQGACRGWAEQGGGDEARRLGCRAGWLEACTEQVEGCEGTLADCVRRAEALASSRPAEATRLARIACSDERTAGCLVYAAVMEQRDPDAAKVAYRWACDAGQREGCDALLQRYPLSDAERAIVERRRDALTQ